MFEKDQSSPRRLEEGFFVTDTQTDGHGNSMTKSAQRGRFSEEKEKEKNNTVINIYASFRPTT